MNTGVLLSMTSFSAAIRTMRILNAKYLVIDQIDNNVATSTSVLISNATVIKIYNNVRIQFHHIIIWIQYDLYS